MFEGDLELKNLDNMYWSTLSRLIYKNTKYQILVEPGFVTDGASIPQPFWSIVGFPLEGKLAKPAIIHDGLYTVMSLPRDTCDKLLLEMLLLNGVNHAVANVIYYAVRLFGQAHWKKDTSSQAHYINILKA